MSSPIDLKYTTQFSYGVGLGGLPQRPVAAPTPAEEHEATTRLVATMLQAVYDMAGELRGLGPSAHAMLQLPAVASLRQRIARVLTEVEAIQGDLQTVRNHYVLAQLQTLGIDENSRDLKLHIGCGGHLLAGWINLDNYPAPLAIDLAWGLPLPNDSARYVFVSHLLEHLFHPAQSHRLLDEIHRVLGPGGVVRIVVPDIEQCIRAYVNKDDAFFASRREHWTWLPEDLTHLESFLAYAGVGPTPEHLFEHHKFGYDFETLERCLERVGFVNIRRCAYQQSPHAALRVDDASSNAGATHDGGHYSLFVEAEVGPS